MMPKGFKLYSELARKHGNWCPWDELMADEQRVFAEAEGDGVKAAMKRLLLRLRVA